MSDVSLSFVASIVHLSQQGSTDAQVENHIQPSILKWASNSVRQIYCMSRLLYQSDNITSDCLLIYSSTLVSALIQDNSAKGILGLPDT